MRAFSQDEHALLPSGWPRASARSFVPSCVRVRSGWVGAGGSASRNVWSYPRARGRTRQRVVVP